MFPHTALATKSSFSLNARIATYDYVSREAHLRSTRVHLEVNMSLKSLLWSSTYSPKCSSFSLIEFRPPGGLCYMLRLEIRRFLSLFLSSGQIWGEPEHAHRVHFVNASLCENAHIVCLFVSQKIYRHVVLLSSGPTGSTALLAPNDPVVKHGSSIFGSQLSQRPENGYRGSGVLPAWSNLISRELTRCHHSDLAAMLCPHLHSHPSLRLKCKIEGGCCSPCFLCQRQAACCPRRLRPGWVYMSDGALHLLAWWGLRFEFSVQQQPS